MKASVNKIDNISAGQCSETQETKTTVNKINEDAASIAKMNNNDIIIKEVKVNGHMTMSFIDPGSNRSLIRESYASQIGGVDSTNILLEGFAGGQFRCTKKVRATILIDRNSFDIDLLVVDDNFINENILLGRDVLCGQGKRLVIEYDDCRLEKVKSLDVSADLTPSAVEQLKFVLLTHQNCFAENTSELGKCNVAKMEIHLTSDKPVQMKPYRVPFAKRSILTNITNDLLRHEIIRPSDSAYASPVVLVEKHNGEHRMCVDYRQLNSITSKTPYPMPIMDEQFAQLANNKYFTTLDLRMGYHQIEVHEDSKKFTAFVTHDGHFEYNRMPFGLVNAPAVFQSVMDKLVKKMGPGEILAYLDDVVIPSKTAEEGLTRLNQFLDILAESGLTLRLDKCIFLSTKISHLGHIIDENGIRPGDGKVSAIKNFPVPTNVTEVRRFLGLTGFFRKFVRDYSLRSKPITQLLRKSETKFVWGAEQQKAFENLIEILTQQPVLALYSSNAHHEVHTDASSLGIAGILLQSTDGSQWKPVIYFSRHCTDAESRYHSYELEALAVVEVLDRFRIYLLGKPFRLVTDCAAVAKVKATKELRPKIARWWMRIQEYDFTLIHREGSRMAHVDALSRAPDMPPIEFQTDYVMKVTADIDDWVVTMQMSDEKLLNIIAVLRGDIKSDQEKQIKSEYCLRNSRLYYKDDDGLKLVIPKNIRWRIVKYSHDDMGHFGLEKTIERIRKKFWFPKIRKYTKEYIASCISCCYNKSRHGKQEARLHYGEVEPVPFQTIHIDHMGPFTKSKRGYCYVLAISDSFSKYLIVKAVRNTKMSPVITVLNEVSSYFGLPKRIITDRGTAFTSKAFADFCTHNSIKHVKTAVRTPRANGQVERANQTILSYIRTTVENPKDWDLTLRELQWTVNSQTNSTTGFSPNELVFDFKLRDIVHNYLAAAIHDDVDEDTVPIAQKRSLAVENIQKQREKWEKRFNAKRAVPKLYAVDDIVVLENEAPATGDSRKLEPKFRGPYVIAKVLGNDRYLIEDVPGIQVTNRKFSSVYSADKIRPWCADCPNLDDLPLEEDDEIEDDLVSGKAELSPCIEANPVF